MSRNLRPKKAQYTSHMTITSSQSALQLKGWIRKSGLSVLDQVLLSGSNFGPSILLARWLTPENYCSFLSTHPIILFLSGIHSALLLEPMTVLGPWRFKDSFWEFFRTNIRLHAFIIMGISGMIFIALVILSSIQ